MLCPSCNSELASGLTICTTCGTPLIPQTPIFDARMTVQDTPAMTDSSIQHAVSPDESIPNIEDIATNTYEVGHPTDKRTYSDRVIPAADEHTFIDNATPTNTGGNVLQSTPRSNPSQGLPTRAGTRGERLSTSMLLIAVLVIFAVLLVIENGGIAVYGAVYLPAQANARATVAAQPQATIDTQATTSAQQMKTAQAQTTVLAQQFSQAQDQADQQPSTIYTQATNGIKIFDDSLNNPNTSLWSAEQFDGDSNCAFSNGAYHAISNIARQFVDCDLPMPLRNFAFQIQMTTITGDEGGLLFHANMTTDQFYYLGMDAATGNYYLKAYKDNNPDHTQMLEGGFMPSFKVGNNQENLVTIIVKGNNIYLYINKQFVFNVINNTYTNGVLALIASDDTKNTDIAFTNAQLWLLLN